MAGMATYKLFMVHTDDTNTDTDTDTTIIFYSIDKPRGALPQGRGSFI